MGLCIDSNIYGMYKVDVVANGTNFHHLQVPGAGHIFEVGKPAVPTILGYFEVPPSVDISLEVLHVETLSFSDYYVIPTQEPPEDMPNATVPPFQLDEATYSADTYYPSDIVSLEGGDGQSPIILRGHRIVAVSLFPVQFNPVTKKIRAYSKIEVRLKYNRPAQIGEIDERLESATFEEICRALILNYQYRPNTQLAAAKGTQISLDAETGAEYLIITNDTFFQQVQPLADWKEKKGLLTKIVRTSDIKTGTVTADDIAAYIKNAYDTWNPAPSYVLLVGDSDFLPTHYKCPHPSLSHGGFDIPSDLYYATVDGDDYFPDILVGRLSVDTPAQTTTIVNKILGYERSNIPTDPLFFSSVSACAQFQDEEPWVNNVPTRDNYEDRRFVLTSEEIRDFLLAEGYNVERIYTTDPAVNPLNYSWPPYNNGDPLPADLLRANGFAWNGGTGDITNAFNGGRFLIYHRDHGLSQNFWNHRPAPQGQWWGWFDGWDNPSFTTGDVAGLANNERLPVVFSIECQAGWFDGETDQQNDPVLVRSFESFCEELLRHPNGGAVAAIGSTRNSFSGYNDYLAQGFIDAIWPNFDPAFSSGGLFSLGQILVYGKIYMATFYGYHNQGTNVTFHLFHLFGDPETPIWTEEPTALTVTHPDTIGSGGVQKFVVTVKSAGGGAVYHAKVCLRKANDVFAVAYTDTSGMAFFEISPSTGGEMAITVTKHNYLPYEGRITVTDAGATLTVNPDQGPSGITVTLSGAGFDDGEDVDIYFGGATPDATFTASGGSFTETFTVPAGGEGPLNIVAVGQTSKRTAITLFRRLPDQPLPDPYLYDQWAPSTWHLNPEGGDPRWNNPDIQLLDSTGNPVASNDLTVGETYTVQATIHNDATADAVNTIVTFEWAFWGAGQKTWHSFGTDTITVPAGGTATATATWTPSITGHTCLMVKVEHPWDEDLGNNQGQENTHVHPVSSPGTVNFTLSNPTETDALVYLEVRQIGQASLWPATVTREYPQVQEPGENRTVTITVEAPDTAQVGEKRIFTVNAYVRGQLIGGIEFEVVVGRETTTTTSTIPGFPSTAITLGLLSALTLVAIVRRRRRAKTITPK